MFGFVYFNYLILLLFFFNLFTMYFYNLQKPRSDWVKECTICKLHVLLCIYKAREQKELCI